MGGDTILNPSNNQMADFVKNLPDLLKTYSENVGPFEQQMLNSKEVIAPQELAFNKGLLDYFGPEMAKQTL
jgi:hypothetical protein